MYSTWSLKSEYVTIYPDPLLLEINFEIEIQKDKILSNQLNLQFINLSNI